MIYQGPSYLSSIPEGNYDFVKSGCFNKLTGDFREKSKYYYDKFPPIDFPDLVLAHLDFDNIQSKRIEVGANYFSITLNSEKCTNQSYYKMTSNMNEEVILDGDNIYSAKPYESCILNKTIDEEQLVFENEYFLKRGLIFSFEELLNFKFKVVKNNGHFYIVFSEKNYMESSYFEVLEDIEDDGVEEEYLNFCPSNHALAWTLIKN